MRIRFAFLYTVVAALLHAASAAAATDAPASWRPWLEPSRTQAAPVSVVFPSAPELASLRKNREWLERWAVPTPSVAWNDVVAELVVKYQQSPLRAARIYAYTHIVMHDAVVQCARQACASAVQPIAMHAAASRMLDFLYPDESRGRLEALGHSAAAAVLASSGSHPQATMAWNVGHGVAQNAIRRALYDGWDLPRLPAKRPAWKPGVWRASPPINIYDPIEPNAAQWRTWALKSGAEIEPPAPVEYGTAAYWTEVDEVIAVAKALTPEQKRIAEDWNLAAGSVTPPGVWNIRARELAIANKLDASHAARMFATLNAAMFDAMVACWHAKYKWWTERPVTVIREHRDPNFLPHIVTPGFPSYVSGHSSASGAAAEVLSAFFPAQTAKLQAMAGEAAMSRLYGGIHFRSDNEEGLVLGRKVGARAVMRARQADAAQSAASTR